MGAAKAEAGLQEKSNGWPKLVDIYFENNETLAYSWDDAITIEDTGMYYLWFVICDEDLASATIRGQTTWKNPTGTYKTSYFVCKKDVRMLVDAMLYL